MEVHQLRRMLSEAWAAGFIAGVGRQPWEDMHDWAWLAGDDYAFHAITDELVRQRIAAPALANRPEDGR